MKLWICVAHHAAFRCGGWASVWAAAGEVSGRAGGERSTTAQRMALAGLASALGELSPKGGAAPVGPLRIETTSPDLLRLAPALTDRSTAPDGDLDLWARIVTLAGARRLDIVRIADPPGSTAAFVAAWADRAMDTAKARGPFTIAIPRSNLAKAPGLA